MKDFKYYFILLTVIVAAACTKEIPAINTPAPGKLVINAAAGSLAPAEATKAHGEYCYEVLWDNNDCIAVTGAAGQGEFKLVEGAGKTLGKFEQVSGPALSGSVTGYYPASLLQDGSVVWPTYQKYSEKLTGVPMSATATVSPSGTNFSFESIGGVLQLVLTSSEGDIMMKSITVSADNLAHPVTLDCSSIMIGAAAKNFAISLPAATYSNIQLRFEAVDGAVSTMQSSSLSIKQGVVSKVTLALSGFSRSFPNYLSFTAIGTDVPVILRCDGNPDSILLEYSFDPAGEMWQSFTADGSVSGNQQIDVIPEGQTMYLRGVTTRTNFSKGLDDAWHFYFNNVFSKGGRVVAKGNIMSLLDPDLKSTAVGEYAFAELFEYVNDLVCAPELPATDLGQYCYYRMFFQCKNLTEAPALPAANISASCYEEMFAGSGLRSSALMYGSNLSTRSCYGMYEACLSLTVANPLPATNLGDECYRLMFSECSSLKTAPALPATTMAAKCYYSMFDHCEALNTAPVLPATKLAEDCYRSMFSFCTSLEIGPDLPATTLAWCCYDYMFNNCHSLRSLSVNFTDWSRDTFYWLKDVSSTGVFCCSGELPLPEERSESYIPEGWNISYTSLPGNATIGTLIKSDGIEGVYLGDSGGKKIVLATRSLGAASMMDKGSLFSREELDVLALPGNWEIPTYAEMQMIADKYHFYMDPFVVGVSAEITSNYRYAFPFTHTVSGGMGEARLWIIGENENDFYWFRADNKYGWTHDGTVSSNSIRLVRRF